MHSRHLLPAVASLCFATAAAAQGWGQRLPNDLPFRNGSGYAATVSTTGSIDLGNPFFQDLGGNGRRCVSCHSPAAGWSVTPWQLQVVFEATRGGVIPDPLGLGAIFRSNDGSNSPQADVSTLPARRRAYSMLLHKGLIRVGMPVPANAEFELVAVDDPYGFASAAEISMFRRPLPTTNLRFLSAVMWDGRETLAGHDIAFDLGHQANSAVLGHAEGLPLTAAQQQAIVEFETALHTAQVYDDRARRLDAAGARGGTAALVAQPFYIGINDLFGDSLTQAPFDPKVFDIYDAWTQQQGAQAAARAAVARGQELFNHAPIDIAGVSGINDEAVFGFPAVVHGTCTTCHDSPNAGDHSTAVPLDIGIAAADRRTPDLPLYTFRNKTTGAIIRTTDPGRALVDGQWQHMNRVKGPVLRGLAARPPYFHNGSAATLAEVVDFYDQRFGIGFSAAAKRDLVAFLQTL